ncbi:MAG TPA: hypothetical protein VGH50_05765 [Candidatus Binatia bacterium]|jgi:hypothetical protein
MHTLSIVRNRIALTCAIFFPLAAAQFLIFAPVMSVGVVFGIDGAKAKDTEMTIDGWKIDHPEFVDVNLDRGSHKIIYNVPGEKPVTVDAYVQGGENYVDYNVDTRVLGWSSTLGGGEYKTAPGDHIRVGYDW